MTVCRQCGSANDTGVANCFKCGGALIAAHMMGKIPCQVHSNREATTVCSSCGARLCDACAYSLNGIDFCETCAPEGAISTEHDEDYEAIPVLDATELERAPFGLRLLAGIVDLGVVILGAGVLFVFCMLLNGAQVNFLNDSHKGLFYFYYLAVVVGALAYPAVRTSMDGQTLGKYFSKVIVLQDDGRIVPITTAAIRSIAMVLSALPLGLGFFWAIWDSKGETWHDKISKTYAFRFQDTT